jgi:hypothetical protein
MPNPFDRFDPPHGQPQGQPELDPQMMDALAHHSIMSGQLPMRLSGPNLDRVADRAAEIAGARGLPPDQAQFAFARYRAQFGGHPPAAAAGALQAAASVRQAAGGGNGHPPVAQPAARPRPTSQLPRRTNGRPGQAGAAPRAVRACPPGQATAAQIDDWARRAETLRDESLPFADGDWNLATGWAAAVTPESGGDIHAIERGRGRHGRRGHGLMQLTNARRRENFRSQMGVDIDHANLAQQLGFGLDYERNIDPYESRQWRRALAGGNDPASIAAGITRNVLRPLCPDHDARDRAAVAAAMRPLPPGRSNPPPAPRPRVPAHNASPDPNWFVFRPVHGG